jgi:hypothetical protein
MRDYDKNPIVIKDYNYIFLSMLGFVAFPYIIYTIINGMYSSALILGWCMGEALILIVKFFMITGKRKIILSNNDIKFVCKDKVIEQIQVDKKIDARKTYNDIYHKSQKPTDLQQGLTFVIFLPLLFIGHLPLIFNKFFFHLFKGINGYKFFDAIIVFDEDKLINILPANKKEYNEVREYFKYKKMIDIKDAKIFWSIFMVNHERID